MTERVVLAEDVVRMLIDPEDASQPVRLENAHVKGELRLGQASIRGAVFERCRFDAPIHLEDAKTRFLHFDRCAIPALLAPTAAIEGSLTLTSCEVDRLQLTGARIAGALGLSDSRFERKGRSDLAIAIDDAVIAGTLDGSGITVRGGASLQGSAIGGQLLFAGADLTGTPVALDAASLAVAGRAELTPRDGRRFRARGTVVFDDATFGRRLRLSGALLDGSGGDALSAQAMEVGGDLDCRPVESFRLTCRGTVRLISAHVRGRIIFNGACLDGEGERALSADRLRGDDGGDFSVEDGHRFQADGEVRMVGAAFGGNVSFNGARLRTHDERAFMADRLRVTGSLLFKERADQRFEATGTVRLVGYRVTSQLGFDGCRIDGALDLDRGLAESMWFRFASAPARVSLLNAEARTLHVAHRSTGSITAARMRLLGLQYEFVDSMGGVGVAEHLRWLERDPDGYAPQPYEQLAKVYAAHGHDDEARRVSIAKERRRRQGLTPWGKAVNWFLGATVAHGYRSSQAGLWLLALLAVGASLFGLVFDASVKDGHADMTPAREAKQVPGFNAFIYTLDVLLPVIDLGQATAWNAHGAAQWIAVALALSGWLLTAALLAGIAARRR